MAQYTLEALVELGLARWPKEIKPIIKFVDAEKYWVEALSDLSDAIAEDHSTEIERILSLNVHHAIFATIHECAKCRL